MPDQPVTTSIDELVKYVREHGETDALTLAAALKVNTTIIGNWSAILEKAGVVKITYKVGKMFVSPAQAATQEAAKAIATMVDEKKAEAESDIETQAAAISKVSERLEEYKRIVSGADKIFKSKAGEMKEALDRMNRLEKEVDDNYAKLRDRKTYVDTLIADLNKEITELNERSAGEVKANLNTDDTRKVLEDIRSKVKTSEEATNTLLANFDKAVKEQRNNLVSMIQSIKSEDAALKEAVNAREKQFENYRHSMEAYERDVTSMRHRMDSERTRIMDELAKAKQSAERLTLAADGEVRKFQQTLMDVKGKFGPYVNLDTQLQGIKDDMESIAKERDALSKDIADLSTELREIGSLTESRGLEKTQRTEEARKKVTEINDRSSKLQKKSDIVRRKIDDLSSKEK